jgi:cysteine desulfurase
MLRLFNKLKHGTPTVSRVYLDYAAATPVLPQVIEAMAPYQSVEFGNPSAIHHEGVQARQAVEAARTAVATTLHIQPSSVTFTSGGTESNNLAISGVVAALHHRGVAYTDMEIITTAIEHPATLQTVEYLALAGVTVQYVGVNAVGRVDLNRLATLLSVRTVLVTIAYVNSEIGTIQDLGGVARVIKKHNRTTGALTLLHTDAAQAPLWLPCSLNQLGVDLLSLDAGKFGGPKGIGVLARVKGTQLRTVVHGGGQEASLRPGTEPVALVVGFALALTLAQDDWKERQEKVAAIRDYFFKKLTNTMPALIINGPLGQDRVANNVNVSISRLDSEFAVISLDVAGIACSTKSACSSAGGGESTVVMAISNDKARASSTLRFTLGPDTTKEEIDRTVTILLKFYSANQG